MGSSRSLAPPSLNHGFQGTSVCRHQASGRENSRKDCTWEVSMGKDLEGLHVTSTVTYLGLELSHVATVNCRGG